MIRPLPASPRRASLAWPEVRAQARLVPPWVWLVTLVALSTLVQYGVGRRIVAPWIFQDELLYQELSKSLVESGELQARGEPFGGLFGVLYPIVIAPAYLLHESIPSAYATAKAINALVFSLAAVPTYLLARRVAAPPLALVAALLVVAVPGGLYTGMVMTESLFYPLVVTVALTMVLALERPTLLRVVALLGALGAAFATRAQAVVFAPVILVAPLLLVAFERTWLRGLARFRWFYGLPAAGAGALLVLQLARGRSLLDLLGVYRMVLDATYHAELVARWSLWHVAHLDLALGVLPFAAFLLLATLAPRLGPRQQAFVAVALPLSVALVLQVSIFASRWSERVQERNMFYVMPLFVVALVLWLELGLPRPRGRAFAAAATAALLPLAIPFERLLQVSATSDTFGLLLWWDVVVLGVPAHRVWIPAFVLAAALALAFLLLPRRLALALPALVLTLFVVSAYSAHGWLRTASLGALFHGITAPERDWVDRAVGRDAEVAVVWSARLYPMWVWQNEFFSRSVGRIYTLEQRMEIGLPQTQLTRNYISGMLLGPEGEETNAEFVLADDHVPLAGTLVAMDEPKGIRLLRVDGPLRLEHAAEGIYGDAWVGRRFEYRRYACQGGRLHVALQQDPKLVDRPQRVVARGGPGGGRILARYTVHPGRELAWMTVPLRTGPEGSCDVQFTVSPTAVPAEVQRDSDDTRELGIRVLGFEYRP